MSVSREFFTPRRLAPIQSFLGFFFLACLVCCAPLETRAGQYMEMCLEDLMGLTVTSMSKRVQVLQETAAAVHIITEDDLRRTGATSIPEALRLVPGFMVGQHSTHIWSVSARGRAFNPTFDHKLLVMVDGRSVYSPVFSGVFWDAFDLVLEDVDRIEVIRGPGSSVWGSNAVNGIVNIITKSAAETQGFMASALYGNVEEGTATLRYGDAFSPENTWRIFAKYRNLDGLHDMDGEKTHDEQHNLRAGFRTDLSPDRDSSLTFLGDLTLGWTKNLFLYPDIAESMVFEHKASSDIADLNMRGRYSRTLGADSSISIQAFLSRFSLETSDLYDLTVNMADLDFQHQFPLLPGHTAQWGAGIRRIGAHTETGLRAMEFDRKRRTEILLSAFVQDEITFDEGRWVFTLGSKFEHNRQTGLEILPSARLLWHATENHAFWTAASRSVRIPSLAEQDASYHVDIQNTPMGLPLRRTVRGNRDVGSEKILICELGHRFTPSTRFFVDTALFATWGDNLFSESFDPDGAYLRLPPASPAPHLQLDSTAGNDMYGTTHGLEISATWTPRSWWRLRGLYAYFEDSCRFRGEGIDAFASSYGRISPRHQLFFRSSMDLPHNIEADIMVRYVSELPGLDIPDYATFDARLGWRPTENIEISLTGKNLATPRHRETSTGLIFGDAAGVDRSGYLKLRVDF